MSITQIIQDVACTVDAMGYLDSNGKTYTIYPETDECLRELLRALKNDSHDHAILRHLGLLNIVETDLIPMIKLDLRQDEGKVYEFLVRLLVKLTYPALIHFKEKLPQIKEDENVYMSLNQYLLNYKVAFSRDTKVWHVLAQDIRSIITKDYADVEEEEKVLLERILILIRNIVHVPKNESLDTYIMDDEVVVEDLIDCFDDSGIFEMLLILCSDFDYHQFAFHCLEIFYHLLRQQSPTFLASNDTINGTENGNTSRGSELLELRDLEKLQKKRSSSFNRFKDATYVVQDVKSISSRDLIIYKTVENGSQITLDHGKQAARRPKNRRPMQDDSSFKSAQLGINYRTPRNKTKKKLQNFCSQFISTCYNPIMNYIKCALDRSHAQDNDETYYFWAAYFFMEFNRASKADCKFIEETISIDYYHYLHTIMEHHLDMISKERFEYKAWFRRLHTALRAYKELVFTIAEMKATVDEDIFNRAELIRNRMFYEIDYRELLLCLISGYHEIKMSKGYLKDLIETNHVFLKMLEKISKSDENFVVRTKVAKRSKKNKKKEENNKPSNEGDDGSSELLWSEIIGEITDTLDGKISLPLPEEDPDVVPFSVLSDKSRDEQKADVMFRIYKLLRQKKAIQAVALFRYAREAFAEDDENAFGALGIIPEEESYLLHEILASDLWRELVDNELKMKGAEAEKDVEESEDEDEDNRREQKFDFLAFVHKYSCAKVIRSLIYCLKTFETNSTHFNHAIMKMCHRISMDCQSPVFFYQLSMFKIFQRAFRISKHDSKRRYQQIIDFAKFIVKSFARMTSGNDKLLVELLFWKTKREVNEIEDNYIKPEPKPRAARKSRKKKDAHESDDEIVKYDSEVENVENELEEIANDAASQKSVKDFDEDFDEMYAHFENNDDDIEDYEDGGSKIAEVVYQNEHPTNNTIIEQVPNDEVTNKSVRKLDDNDDSDNENITVKRKKLSRLDDSEEELESDGLDNFLNDPLSVSFSTAQTSTQTKASDENNNNDNNEPVLSSSFNIFDEQLAGSSHSDSENDPEKEEEEEETVVIRRKKKSFSQISYATDLHNLHEAALDALDEEIEDDNSKDDLSQSRTLVPAGNDSDEEDFSFTKRRKKATVFDEED